MKISSSKLWSEIGDPIIGASFTALMVRVKLCDADKVPSLASTTIFKTPLKSAGGCPENVLPSKISQAGIVAPSISRAVSVSSSSTSVNASAGNAKSTKLSSSNDWFSMAVPIIGASLTALIDRTKLSDALSSPSLAVTTISTTPLKSAGGVPTNRFPSKDNHSGSVSPSEVVATSVNASPSRSVNAFSGSAKSTSVSSSKL